MALNRLRVIGMSRTLSLVSGLSMSWGVQAASQVTVGGPFALAGPDAAVVTDQTYRGKWLMVYFGYTHCPDSCPTALVEIGAALAKLGPDAATLQPLFITVDPQRDTPQVLKDYTGSFDQRIVGLTGTEAQIETVAGEYGAYFARRQTAVAEDDYVVDHSTYIYIMDPNGHFVRAFDTSESPDSMVAKLRGLMNLGGSK